MTIRADFQPLIDWCTQPGGGHVASAHLFWWYSGEGGSILDWDGSLVFWPWIPRRRGSSVGEFLDAAFSGVLDPSSTGSATPSTEAHVWLTVADDEAWLSVQGPSWLGKEWHEGVPVYRGEPTFGYPQPTIEGEKPQDFHAWMAFYAANNVGGFKLQLACRYLWWTLLREITYDWPSPKTAGRELDPIHPSAWNRISAKSLCSILYKVTRTQPIPLLSLVLRPVV